jgi:creatinine amidohydrolase
MAAQAELFRAEVAKALPPNPESLSQAIRAGKNSFEEAGGPQAYFGYPADASVNEGNALYLEMADIFASGARTIWQERA